MDWSSGRWTSERERETDTDDGQRLCQREADEGDRLEATLGLGLARHTLDVGGEDQADADTGTDCGQAVADHVEVAFHGTFPFVVPAVCGEGVRARSCGSV